MHHALIKPIRTEEENEAALRRIEQLFNVEPGTPEADEVEVLVTLVEAFEKKAYHLGGVSAIDAIKFEMDQRGLKAVDLVPYIGQTGRVYEVLNGKRQLSLSMIRKLHAAFGIPMEILVGEEPADAKAS